MDSVVEKVFNLIVATEQGEGSSVQDDAPGVLARRANHWSHVESFLGVWIRIPLKTFEQFCYINYRTPPPHPIDPAVMFDVLKIMRLVEEARKHVSRAEAAEASPFGRSTWVGPKQKLRIREQACECLRKAYQIEENACAVATMFIVSVDEVAARVLLQKPNSADAQYVQLFHEMVSQRQLATPECVEMLTEILDTGHISENLRTRAAVNAMLGNEGDAITDLTLAITRSRYLAAEKPKLSDAMEGKNPRQPVPEDKMPGSLSSQLLFHRAIHYLAIACKHISTSFGPEIDSSGAPATPEDQDEVALGERITSQRLVRENAKNAINSLMSFLRSLKYSPDWPIEASHDFSRFISTVFTTPSSKAIPPLVRRCTVATNVMYPVSRLFFSAPIDELPPYPPPAALADEQSSAAVDIVKAFADQVKEPSKSCESVTFHPYLIEALHALLLCHCLINTSKKEIRRHAYMVARLVRLCDGYPIFNPARSPARDDWKELVGYPASDTQLLPLVASWDDLCRPKYAPLLTQFSRENTTAATEDAQPAGGDLFASAALLPPSEAMRTLEALAKMRSQNQPPNSEMPIHQVQLLPGCRIEDNIISDGLPDRRDLRTGHARDIRRWLKENPVVPSVRRKKKTASRSSSSRHGEDPEALATKMSDLEI
ncbi:hypothetical protein A9K55_007821 [Cordyceps militaris]|uniref:Uncharacterized protein n=1 Tax=Cordyceps militaris TaxID=73501 RepID=A0A2H4SGV9_CORMI|nr:hypothetical protein A9K55_007821 [Cordyceps militaris]